MNTTLIEGHEVQAENHHIRQRVYAKIRPLLLTWELYPILILALFLRLYHIDAATFVDDDAVVFRLARDFFTHGLFPITGNRASLGGLNPPFSIYIYMLPAAISGNPLWAEVTDALFNVAAVLLTYFFTRRYYGRVAGTSAALFYATAVKAILYSRNIWQPNLIPFFTLLLMFLLFRGAVEKRKGWFAPAIGLMCILYQLHGSTVLLGIPLAVAVLFAYKTIRWYDLLLAVVIAVFLFLPYLYLESLNHFADIHLILSSTNTPPQVDTQAIDYYKNFLSPYTHSLDINDHFVSWPTNPGSLLQASKLRYLQLPFVLEFQFVWLLLDCSIFLAALLVLVPHPQTSPDPARPGSESRKNAVWNWWLDLYATPTRVGILLLLCWQGALLLLLRHSIQYFPHYFIVFLPGQFILMGLFLGKVIEFFQRYRPDFSKVIRYGAYSLVVLITLFQLLGSFTALIDNARGRFDADPNPWWPGFNTVSAMQNALTEADRLAQARHIHRIYFPTIYTTTNPVRIMAEQIKTPVTTFDGQRCTILPDPSTGPVIFVGDASNGVLRGVLQRYTNETLRVEVARIENPAFEIYVLTAKAATKPVSHTFTSDLQLLEAQAHPVPLPGTTQKWIVSHWRILRSTSAAPFTTYNFNLQTQMAGSGTWGDVFSCKTTNLVAGDQILLYQDPPIDQSKISSYIQVRATVSTSSPVNYALGPLTLATYNIVDSPLRTLKTEDGKDVVTLPIS